MLLSRSNTTRDEAIKKILQKAKVEKSISQIVFELTFKNISFRLYGSGKAIFRSVKIKDELNTVLSELLS
jgi:ribonuclease HIII